MADLVFRLSVFLAVAAGSAGLVTAVFAWRSFRGAPFGRALAVLGVFMATFTVYHAGIGLSDGVPVAVLAVESLAFALVAIHVGLMVRLHRQRLHSPAEEVDRR